MLTFHTEIVGRNIKLFPILDTFIDKSKEVETDLGRFAPIELEFKYPDDIPRLTEGKPFGVLHMEGYS